MKNNMDYSHLVDRIRNANSSVFTKMSPESMARLTDGFKEPLVREMLYTRGVNEQQLELILAIRKAYIDWKKSIEPLWGMPMYPVKYPEYLEDLKMDIELGMVVTKDGTFRESGVELKLSLIPSDAVPVKPNPIANQSSSQISKDDNMNNKIENRTEYKDKVILDLTEKISRIQAEFDQYKKEHSITQEQFDAIFSEKETGLDSRPYEATIDEQNEKNKELQHLLAANTTDYDKDIRVAELEEVVELEKENEELLYNKVSYEFFLQLLESVGLNLDKTGNKTRAGQLWYMITGKSADCLRKFCSDREQYNNNHTQADIKRLNKHLNDMGISKIKL